MPIGWDELERLSGADQWTVRNVRERLVVGNAPWADYEARRQGLGAAIKRLASTPASEIAVGEIDPSHAALE